MPDINPWEGVAMPGQNPAPGNAGPVRNTPLDNRAIRNMEILSGQAGEPLDHAVRFRDIQELEAKLLDTIQRNSSIFSVALARRIESQFQAIDTESKGVAQEITASFQTLEGLVATFSETFTDALDTTNANIATNYYTIAQTDSAIAALETSVTTELNGLETSVTTLSGSVDGIEGVHAIQIDNNGYISGFGLISSIRDGLPVSDFIISDASFRVVNSAGAGNYTPFAVFPTTRTVDGATVPAGVYAQDMFITRANITDLAVNNAKISDLAVSTLKIQDNAVTVPVAISASNAVAFGTSFVNVLELSFARVNAPILISWGAFVNTTATGVSVDYQIQALNGGTVIWTRGFNGIQAAGGQNIMFYGESILETDQAFWPSNAVQTIRISLRRATAGSFNVLSRYIQVVAAQK